MTRFLASGTSVSNPSLLWSPDATAPEHLSVSTAPSFQAHPGQGRPDVAYPCSGYHRISDVMSFTVLRTRRPMLYSPKTPKQNLDEVQVSVPRRSPSPVQPLQEPSRPLLLLPPSPSPKRATVGQIATVTVAASIPRDSSPGRTCISPNHVRAAQQTSNSMTLLQERSRKMASDPGNYASQSESARTLYQESCPRSLGPDRGLRSRLALLPVLYRAPSRAPSRSSCFENLCINLLSNGRFRPVFKQSKTPAIPVLTRNRGGFYSGGDGGI